LNFCKITAALFLLGLSAANVVAQAPHSIADNTIDCTAFERQPDGWFVGAPTTLNFGAINMRLSNQLIQPHSGIRINNVDLYEAIEHKCGGNHSEKP
jgi:hypothetical protein